MVYTKDDGSFGFSWQQQYDFLLREHPEDLESIVQSKFSLLKTQQPEKAKYYEELEAELTTRIGEAWDKNPNFGYKESDEVVKTFVKHKGLSELFRDVPALSSTDEDDEPLEMSDLSEEDELIAQYGQDNLRFVRDQDWVCDDLDHYLGNL